MSNAKCELWYVNNKNEHINDANGDMNNRKRKEEFEWWFGG